MMKRTIAICVVTAVLLAANGVAQAEMYEFWFSEEDLWNHTASGDTRLYDQDAPRRHHTRWKGAVQTTDSAQGSVDVYQGLTGTNGWTQTTTYDAWLAAGPKDNEGNDFGISAFNLWGAGWPNARRCWQRRWRCVSYR